MTALLDRRTVATWLAAVLVLAVAGCSTGVGASPSPTPGPQRSASELRLLLIHQLGPLWYCDRDSYPVGRDEQQAALDSYDEMVADAELFTAVAADLGIDPGARHTDAQKLALYRGWKVAQAVRLEPIGNDRYRFDYLAQPVGGAEQGKRTAGIIDSRGGMTVEQEGAAGEPMCPICLDGATTIDKPSGGIPVDRLRLGDLVWTLDEAGARAIGTVIALGSTPAPAGHHVIHVTLADGRSVSASPGHPLADGRTFDQLSIGDSLDGSTVTSLESVRYIGGETFDLVVSGSTGVYFAGGIPLASTID